MFDIAAALESQFDEVHYLDFYRDIFPEGSFEERGVYEDGKYNGIAVTIAKGSKRAKRLTVSCNLMNKGAIYEHKNVWNRSLLGPDDISGDGGGQEYGNSGDLWGLDGLSVSGPKR